MHLFQQHAPADLNAAIGQIPIIDFGPYFAGRAGALAPLADEVRDACERVGFLYIKGHGVPQVLIDRAFAESKRFHALPLETKLNLSLDQNNVGYLPMNSSTQKHSTVHQATRPNENESFFVIVDRPADHPDVRAGKPLRGMNQWPDGLPGFRENVMAYFSALNALGQRMLPAFAVALGMPADYFTPLFDDDNHATLRMLHYPPTSGAGADNAFGQGPHTDNSFLTILARMEVPGLGVQLPSGVWVAPPLIPGTFLVNLGNMMRRMSNDRFRSTPHGVIVDGKADRYSLAYFHSPNPYRTIEVLPSCISADRPAKYAPALSADLILEFFRANYAHQKGHATAAMPNRYA
ncbi:MAG: isopenicillin N synthase family oxygenase [Betaproteobacteria bacterium]|nr:isopenicillin N synthase family oxygenase [Betaproteobacteria bacterium]